MTMVYKNNLKKITKINFFRLFLWIFRPRNYVSMRKQGMHTKLCGAQIGGPKLRGAKIEGKFAPRSFGPLKVCPAEFWSNATCAPLLMET